MTTIPPQPAPPASRADGPNVLAIVALALAGLVALAGVLNAFLPVLVNQLSLPISALASALGVGSLVLMLVGAACAIIGLRHPRKVLPAIALGYHVVSLIQLALWSGLFPALMRVFAG
ncbi:hypothetical protein [Microbacterium sp.]|uniref:hypothetical protein n=1 Tax=Microbacterium sp. TaxID=51671 RepID=UPI002810EBE1|nr:hypothetical protein [Microbacterium sp.]